MLRLRVKAKLNKHKEINNYEFSAFSVQSGNFHVMNRMGISQYDYYKYYNKGSIRLELIESAYEDLGASKIYCTTCREITSQTVLVRKDLEHITDRKIKEVCNSCGTRKIVIASKVQEYIADRKIIEVCNSCGTRETITGKGIYENE